MVRAMPTPRRVACDYSSQPAAVLELLSNPDFLRTRCEDAGEDNVEVTVTPIGDGLRVVIARDKQVRLPSFARRLFQAKNRVVDSVTWRQVGQQWVGEYAIEIGGLPGHIQGSSTLVPLQAGCRHESSFEVTASVPLFASKLETFVADLVEKSFREYAHQNAQRLKS